MRRILPYVASMLIILLIGLVVCWVVIDRSEVGKPASDASGPGAADKGNNAAEDKAQSDHNAAQGDAAGSGDPSPAVSDNVPAANDKSPMANDQSSAANGNASGANKNSSVADDNSPGDDENSSIKVNPEMNGEQGGGSGKEDTQTNTETDSEKETKKEAASEQLPFRDPDHIVNLDTTLYTYDMMVTDLKYLAAVHPDIMELTSIGTTADGRELYTVYFGNRAAGRQIFIGAATHGREYMTTQLVMKQLEFYSAHYYDTAYNGVPLSDIFARTCFVIVPMINPDGVSISQLGEQGVRRQDLLENIRAIYGSDIANGYTNLDFASYLVRWKANAQGVDLNRNFSPGWESVSERSAPSADFYKGTAPGDQAESAALMGLMNSLSNALLAISYHSYGDLVYYQYGQQGDLYARNEILATHIHNLAGHYLAGYSNEAGFTNWCVHVRGIPAVVVETGTVPTPLPLSQFADLWAKHQWMWAMLGTVY